MLFLQIGFASSYRAWTLCVLVLPWFGTPAYAAGKREEPGVDLFKVDHVAALQIEISAMDMNELRQLQTSPDRSERKGFSVTVREEGNVYGEVDMHLKGRGFGSFRPITDKPAFTLTFDKHRAGQSFHGLRKISLNNSVEDPTQTSEAFCRELYRASGVPAPRVGVATVRLNDKDAGVYVLVEGYTRQFLKQHFKNPNGNLYDADPGEEIDGTGKQPVNSGLHRQDQSRLSDLVAAALEPDLSKRIRRLEQVLDVDRFVSMLAVDVMINNWDGYSLGRNNYRMYHDLPSNKIVFLPHGLDLTFSNPKATVVPRLSGLIGRALLETPQAQRRYLQRLSELTEKLFDAPVMTNRIRQWAAPVTRELASRDPKQSADHQGAVDDYCARVLERSASVKRQLAAIGQRPRLGESQGIPLRQWTNTEEFGRVAFAGTNVADQALVVRAEHGQAIARWTHRVWLERGRYRFQGRIRTTSVVAVQGTVRSGAALRPANRQANDYAVGDQDWRMSTVEFEVFDPLYEVELVCELRAEKGEAQFERESLRLFRIPD